MTNITEENGIEILAIPAAPNTANPIPRTPTNSARSENASA
jgi:hypothetical protein